MKFQQIENGTILLQYHGVDLLLNLNVNESMPESVKDCDWSACVMSSVPLYPHSSKKDIDLPRSVPIYAANQHDADRLTKMGFDNVMVVVKGGMDIGGISLKVIDLPESATKGRDACLLMSAPDEKSVLIASEYITYDELKHDIEETKAPIIIVDGYDKRLDDNDLLKEKGHLIKALENIYRIAGEEPHQSLILTHLNRYNSIYLNQEDAKHWIDRLQKKHWILIPEIDKSYEF